MLKMVQGPTPGMYKQYELRTWGIEFHGSVVAARGLYCWFIGYTTSRLPHFQYGLLVNHPRHLEAIEILELSGIHDIIDCLYS